jgi:hypothetical protein
MPSLPDALDCKLPKRQLRIVIGTNGMAVFGVCERCNAQFKGEGIQEQFDAHKGQPVDSSQNALQNLRESTQGN